MYTLIFRNSRSLEKSTWGGGGGGSSSTGGSSGLEGPGGSQTWSSTFSSIHIIVIGRGNQSGEGGQEIPVLPTL